MRRQVVDIPRYLNIFGSWRCMYRCPGCYHTHSAEWEHIFGDKPRFMSLDTFKKIVDEMAPHRTTLGLYSPGENFLNPDTYDMIDYAESNGCNLECDTTGAPMDPDRLAAVNPTSVMVSIDGFSQETYGAFRRNGSFENVLDRVTRLSEAIRKRGSKTRITLKYLVNALTEDEVEEAREYYEGLHNVTFKLDFFLPPASFAEYANNRLAASIEEYEKWRPRKMTEFDIYVPNEEEGIAQHRVMLEGRHGPHCESLFTTCTLDTDGTVMPCCNIDFRSLEIRKQGLLYFGNFLTDGGILKVFHGERANKCREEYYAKNAMIEKCYTCRHSFSVEEKQPMAERIKEAGFKTMLTGVQPEDA